MEKMEKGIFLLFLLFSLFLLALFPMIAFSLPTCPNVARIKLVGVNPRLFRDAAGNWAAGRTSQQYGTINNWTFVIYNIKANNNLEAFSKANQALYNLTYKSGPNVGRTRDEWYCTYTAGMFQAVTVTPSLSYPEIISSIPFFHP